MKTRSGRVYKRARRSTKVSRPRTRSMMRSRVPRSIASRLPILVVKRFCSGSTVVQPGLSVAGVATGNVDWWYQFVAPTLNNGFPRFGGGTTSAAASLTNLSEFQNIFDQYKLGGIKISLRPNFQNNTAISNSLTISNPPMQVCVCYDPMGASIVTPGSTQTWGQAFLNTLLEHGGKVRRADRDVNIYIKPKIIEQYGGAAGPSNRYVKPSYTDLSTASGGPNVPHRGVHIMFFNKGFNATAFGTPAFDCYVTYYLKFKNPR